MNTNVIRVCRDIAIDSFEDFYGFIQAVYPDIYCIEDEIYLRPAEDDGIPCYMAFLKGSDMVYNEHIPVVLEAACVYHDAGSEGIIMVSVTSAEANHKEWLEQAQNYPGATVTVTNRVGRTCYCLLFPVTPSFPD